MIFAALVYMTVCFEKHSVTIVALDAAPVEPKSFYECVDVNTGQRCVGQAKQGLHALL